MRIRKSSTTVHSGFQQLLMQIRIWLSSAKINKRVSSQEIAVLHRCGVLQDNFVLSTRLIMWIGHCKQIQKLTFGFDSDKGLTLETSAFDSLYSGQFTLLTQLIKPNYPQKLAPFHNDILMVRSMCPPIYVFSI